MPRIIQCIRPHQKGDGVTRDRRVASPTAVVPVHRPISKSPVELAAHALSLLWRRLFASYRAFRQPGAVPFVVSNPDDTSRGVRDAEWASPFGPLATVDNLIFHFYVNNEPFDTFSWVIALCLLDTLQLDYYVQQRVRLVSAVQLCGSNGGTAAACPPAEFRLYDHFLFETLFTVYGLAMKFHLDYSVTLNYLVGLLPHPRSLRKSILRHSAILERRILGQIHYDCYIHETQVIQLLDHFLTPNERSYILQSLLH